MVLLKHVHWRLFDVQYFYLNTTFRIVGQPMPTSTAPCPLSTGRDHLSAAPVPVRMCVGMKVYNLGFIFT